MNKKVAILLSGGLDSTTLLSYYIHERGFPKSEIIALSVFYGQKHAQELLCAQQIVKYFKIDSQNLSLPHSVIEVLFRTSKSALTNPEIPIPQCSYDKFPYGTVPTFVPFRNGILLSLAAAYAQAHEVPIIAYAAHLGDANRAAYPDCSFEFCQAVGDAIRIGTGNLVHLETPFLAFSKANIVQKGLQLETPYSLTRSCYTGNQLSCGVCPTCIERQDAFHHNNSEDPISYESRIQYVD